MYILYESNSGELQTENGITEIIGLYTSYQKAIDKMLSIMQEDIDNNNFVEDVENETLDYEEKDISYITMFYNSQENWNCFYQLNLEKIDLDVEK